MSDSRPIFVLVAGRVVVSLHGLKPSTHPGEQVNLCHLQNRVANSSGFSVLMEKLL